jgi:hypothetical protein
MTPTQAEMILRLAENTDDVGQNVNAEINRLGREHALRLLNDRELIAKALEINRLGCEQFAAFMPKPAQPTLRQAIQQGPTALIQGGKDGQAPTQEQRPAGGQRS